jgi:hypothetical protein
VEPRKEEEEEEKIFSHCNSCPKKFLFYNHDCQMNEVKMDWRFGFHDKNACRTLVGNESMVLKLIIDYVV